MLSRGADLCFSRSRRSSQDQDSGCREGRLREVADAEKLQAEDKALRYIARELAACLPEDAGNVSGDMRKMQDKLGEWCDARVNAALMAFS